MGERAGAARRSGRGRAGGRSRSATRPGRGCRCPPPRRSRCVHSPRMRARLYSSWASSTWSLPSAEWAWPAKMSRITAVRSMTGTPELLLQVALLARAELVVAGDDVGVGGLRRSALTSCDLARAEVEVGVRLVAPLDQLADDRDAGRAQQLLSSARSPSGQAPTHTARCLARPGSWAGLVREGRAAVSGAIHSSILGSRCERTLERAAGASRSGRAARTGSTTRPPPARPPQPAARGERVGGVGGGAGVELVERAVPEPAVGVATPARSAPRCAAAAPHGVRFGDGRWPSRAQKTASG